MNNEYRRCTRCIMDTTAANITFDEQGICNFCTDYLNGYHKHVTTGGLPALVEKIKADGKGKEYDCIVGVSGGVDSSFTLYTVVKSGLRPLAVHLDNGWNSELAVSNITNLIKKLNVDLYTHVIEWEENRDMQLSFIKANVLDIEMLMDNAQAALNFRVAKKYNLHYILSGSNTATEGILAPNSWVHYKYDVKNIKAIHKKFGTVKIKTHPLMSTIDYLVYTKIHKIKWELFLDYMDYNKQEAIEILKREIGYKPYPYKHYESVFTRFYQGYILPEKFNIDKRKIHLSTLIMSKQLSREEALEHLETSPYPDPNLLQQDIEYVMKKFGMTREQLDNYIAQPGVPHDVYPTEEPLFKSLVKFYQLFKKGKHA
ncbi:N-acetyl sugar amidotransferase [Aquirufa sp. Wall-65K1]